MSSSNTRAVKLIMENVSVHDFVNEGVQFNGPGGDLVVRDSSIFNNGAAAIRVASTLAGQNGIVHVTIDRTLTSLSQQGVRFEGNAFGVINNSVASNNLLNGYVVFPTAVGNAEMNIVDSAANNNRQFGVFAGGTGFTGLVRIIGLTAIHNTSQQLQISTGGQLCSNQKNHIGTPTMAPSCMFPDQ